MWWVETCFVRSAQIVVVRKEDKYKQAIALPSKPGPRATQQAKLATLNSISPRMKARNRATNANETCPSPYSCFQSAHPRQGMGAESALAAICFMWGTGEVWKCSVVMRKDTEAEERAAEEEVEAEMAVAPAMRMAWAYQAEQIVWSEWLLKVTGARPWSWWAAWLHLSSPVPLLTVVRM